MFSLSPRSLGVKSNPILVIDLINEAEKHRRTDGSMKNRVICLPQETNPITSKGYIDLSCYSLLNVHIYRNNIVIVN